MADKKYVPQGVYLACDKGTVPTEFTITNNNNVFLFEEPVANTGDLAPNVNVMPFGACSVKNGSPCMPVPTSWQGFEDGIFIGNFNPLLEDSILPCGLGGKIEIFYSLEEAEAACDDGGMSFWEIVGAAVLVVAAVALIVVTGGAVLAAVAAVGAASGALATTIAVAALTLEVVGLALEVKALYDYTQDGDEEALFKGVALGFLFLGAGKVVGKFVDKASEAYKARRLANSADEVIEVVDDIPPWKGPTDYSDIDVSKFKMGEGKNFTQAHKKAVYEANLKHNDGILRSDMDGTMLEEAVKSKKGVTPPSNEAQLDHIIAKSKGGINNPSENAQVLSRKQNRIKSNN